jgi:N-acetylglucosaminyldiphosphoundecaprenol N-acetyl-beta-D-mannosaminyltransferase
MNSNRQIKHVLGTPINVITWGAALNQLSDWAVLHESRTVCNCNVHSIVTAIDNQPFGNALKSADMTTPDGAPVAMMLRRLGHEKQQRINGPDLMWRYCEQAQYRDESIFFYGSTEETLAKLKAKLLNAFPNLKIAGAISPPYRELSAEEDAAIVKQINASGAGIVWVSLGCPKQELWMEAHRGRINAVMVGVGAAFAFHAGTIKRAPKWMQNCSLEWLHRLASEPRRLWRRYLFTNTVFVIGAVLQLLSTKGRQDRHQETPEDSIEVLR